MKSIRWCAALLSLMLLAACSLGTTKPVVDTPPTQPAPPVTSDPAKPKPTESPKPAEPKPTEPKPAEPKPSDPKAPTSEPKVWLQNQAFQLLSPEPKAKVATGFKVKGKARVFEAAFSYTLEDGHNVLAEGHVMAKQGAPAWGDFEFTVTFKKPTSPNGVLTLYEISAKDGSRVNQLHIPVAFGQ